jgi:hypothetical protein
MGARGPAMGNSLAGGHRKVDASWIDEVKGNKKEGDFGWKCLFCCFVFFPLGDLQKIRDKKKLLPAMRDPCKLQRGPAGRNSVELIGQSKQKVSR